MITRGCPSDCSLVGVVNNDSSDSQSPWLRFQDSLQLGGRHKAGVEDSLGQYTRFLRDSSFLDKKSLLSSWREFLVHRKLQPIV